MSKVLVNDSTLSSLGNIIRDYKGEENTYTPAEMVTNFQNMKEVSKLAPTDDELTLTGGFDYKFYGGGWNWFLQKYGNKIKTSNITSFDRTFYNNSIITEIPFELNFNPSATMSFSYSFDHCSKLRELPKIRNCSISSLYHCFSDSGITRVEDDNFENVDFSSFNNNSYSLYAANIFYNCYYLRYVSPNLLKHIYNSGTNYSSTSYYHLFTGCYVLNEINNLGVIKGTISSGSSLLSYGMGTDLYRLKDFTFDTNEDGTAKTAKFKGATLNLSISTGFSNSYNSSKTITSYGKITGIDWNKAVYNDETYQRLKNDPDWFSSGGYNNGSSLTSSTFDLQTSKNYSRYNHDSAIRTINSLPDTSAYGTNTIKFCSTAGALTDGGAINTLTEEEIAVAAAKGWTVSFVN